MKYSGFKKLHNNFLSLKILNGLKGLASLSILIGHINLDNQEYAEKELYQTPPGLGRFYPAFFMFCSGYGLMVSFKKKKDYLNNFLKKRVLSILIPYSLCRVIGYISDIYINYDSKSLFYYLNPKIIFKNIILFDHNWFACEIIILYFLFYLLFKLFQNRNLNRFIILILSWLIIFIPTYYSNSEKHIKYIFVREYIIKQLVHLFMVI